VIFIAFSLLFLVAIEKLAGNESAEQIRHIRLKENSPSLNRLISPDAEIISLSDGLTVKEYPFNIDANGFLKPSLVHRNPDKIIAFIGGSTTESMFVDEDKRFPTLVGTLLEKRLNKKINTLNSGVSGNNTLHSINSFLNKIVPLQPDIAVLMHNINDLSVLLHEGSYWNQNEYRSMLVNEDHSIKPMIKHLLPNTYNLIYKIKTKLLGKDSEFAAQAQSKPALAATNILQMFNANLKTFIQIARNQNITPVLMTQANRFTENPDPAILKNLHALENIGMSYAEYRKLYLAMNDEIRKVAAENDVLLIDLAKEVPQTKEMMADPVHFNAAGSELVAKIITKQIEPLIAE
jgi:lysophospholipase L1-like esterase